MVRGVREAQVKQRVWRRSAQVPAFIQLASSWMTMWLATNERVLGPHYIDTASCDLPGPLEVDHSHVATSLAEEVSRARGGVGAFGDDVLGSGQTDAPEAVVCRVEQTC